MPFSDYILFSPEYAPGVLNLSQGKDILKKVTSERIDWLSHTLHDLSALLRERAILNQNLQSKIDDRICYAVNLLFETESYRPNPDTKCSIQRLIEDLFKEKRTQELALWRDVRDLKKDMTVAEEKLRSALLDQWLMNLL